MENTFNGGNHLQIYQSKETLSALMTINYPVVLLLVYREGGNETEWGAAFFTHFLSGSSVCLLASASIWGIHRAAAAWIT